MGAAFSSRLADSSGAARDDVLLGVERERFIVVMAEEHETAVSSANIVLQAFF